MIHTSEQESMLRYLLGELTEQEQAEIEGRYFNDAEFFEDMLEMEEVLTDEYIQARAATSKLDKKDEMVLARLEQLPEAAFAKQWLAASAGSQTILPKEGRLSIKPSPLSPHWREFYLTAGLTESAEATLRDQEAAAKSSEERESLLVQAWENRMLVTALMENDWLGLQILLSLESGLPLDASDLAAAVNAPVDSLIPLLQRLRQFDAIKQEGNSFSLTDKGAALVKNLEEAAADHS